MNELGKLMVTLGLDHGDFDKGMDQAQGKMGSLGGAGKVMGLAVAAGGAAAAGGLVYAIKSAADFEKTISAVGAVSGATKGELGQLSDAALRIGKDTAFSATEAASAMEELAAQGVSTSDIINGAADATVALAAAGGTDLVTAATAASSAMNIWHLGTADMTEVVNRLTGAANVSAFGIEDMTQGLAAGGIAASTFGISMEDTTTTLAALSKAGFQSGSDAGTSFKAMITSLAAPVGAGAKEIGKLGINVRDASGNMLPMSGIITELHKKMDTLSKADRDAAMSKIFGSDGMRAAGGLMKMTGQEFEDMSATMEKTDAAAIAAKRMDNFSGALEGLKGTIEVMAITLGLKLLPALTTAARWLSTNLPIAVDTATEYVQRFLAVVMPIGTQIMEVLAPALSQLADLFMKAFDFVINNQDALTAVVAIIGTGLVLAFGALALSAGLAVVAMVGAAAPFIAIALAAGLVVAGIILLVKHWDEAVEKFPVLGTIVDGVKNRFFEFIDWVKAEFVPGFTDMVQTISLAMEKIAGFIQKHWASIQKIFEGAGKIIVSVIDAAFTLLESVIQGGMDIITGIIKLVMGILTGDWEMAWDGIKQILEGVWTLIKGVVETGWILVKGIITGGLQILAGLWEVAWAGIKTVVSNIWDGITSAIGDAIEGVKSKVSDGLGKIEEFFTGLRDRAYDLGYSILEMLGNGIEAAGRSALQKAENIASKIGSAMNPGNWFGSPKGIQNWFPYYLDMGMDKMAQTARANGGADESANRIGAPFKAMFLALVDSFQAGTISAKDATAALSQALGYSDNEMAAFLDKNGKRFELYAKQVTGGFFDIGWATEGMANTISSSLAPLEVKVGEFIQGVVEDGDVLNDWLGLLPKPVQEAAKIWGENFVAMKDKSKVNLTAVSASLVAFGDSTQNELEKQIRTWRWWQDSSAYELANAGIAVNDARAVGVAAVKGWMNELDMLLGQGREMSVGEIGQMFMDMTRLIQDSDLDRPTRDALTDMADALMDGFRRTGSLANSAVTDLINQIVGALNAGAGPVASAAAGIMPGNVVTGSNTSALPPGTTIVGGQIIRIPTYAHGTSNHPGGPAWVGEDGPELMNMPRGSRVLSNSDSMAVASGKGGVTIQQNGPVIIHANDVDQGRSSYDSYTYQVAARLRARGVALS